MATSCNTMLGDVGQTELSVQCTGETTSETIWYHLVKMKTRPPCDSVPHLGVRPGQAVRVPHERSRQHCLSQQNSGNKPNVQQQ